jgi:epoxyqueuosine reductase
MKNLYSKIQQLALECGFQQAGISDIDLSSHEKHLQEWLNKKFHGEMNYMEKHGTKRSRPAELVPNTTSIISVRMDYLAPDSRMIQTLRDRRKGYIARYALGRDYHKVLKKSLNLLAKKIQQEIKIIDINYRAFVDSAPVLEKAIGEKAGLGWIGKNTLLLNKQAGSYFFLGEIYTNIPMSAFFSEDNSLPLQEKFHCGSCTACIDVCPTKAIVGSHQLDARRCISYLTIEYKKSIPIEFRKLMGNRIFGCDDCQIVCPWNKFAHYTQQKDFQPRHKLDHQDLIILFSWTEEEFLSKTEGSAIRRAGYICWLRNIAVALGNAPKTEDVIQALHSREHHESELVREHVKWALENFI